MKHSLVKALKRLSVAAFALSTLNTVLLSTSALADPPSNTVNPRNAVLWNGYINSNAVNTVSNILTYTNIILTPAFQHNMSVTTLITGTNQVVPAALNFTNTFDLGKIVVTNNGSTTTYTTNWTTNAISLPGTGNGYTNSVAASWIPYTNYDGYELIRLTKIGSAPTNNYIYQVILGQTP